MATQAHAKFDPAMLGVAVAVVRDHGGTRQVLRWQPVEVVTVTEASGIEPPADHWLRLIEDDARAIYEALADYFGHAGHDIRSLRKDYDAERVRVDRFIAHLTGRGL